MYLGSLSNSLFDINNYLFEFSLNFVKTGNLVLFFAPLILQQHPLHLKTLTSLKRSRLVLVKDYYSVVRKQETSRLDVREGSQSLWLTDSSWGQLWANGFVLGCLKAFHLLLESKSSFQCILDDRL